MLILTRRVGESIKIGDSVTVTVLASKGNQIRIGIDAPREIEVHRQEVWNKIHGKGQQSNPLNKDIYCGHQNKAEGY